MDAHVFAELRSIIHAESGIALTEEKKSLLANRIAKRLRALNLADPEAYLSYLKSDKEGKELLQLTEVISTNFTYFNREPKHFEIFETYLEKLLSEDRREIKVWCAAASSGEEPYTLAITASEVFESSFVNWKILATDISIDILKRAVQGEYVEKQVASLPLDIRRKYFNVIEGPEEKLWRVNDYVRGKILYKKLNLSKFPYPLRGSIDVIFCRNVMIYFDLELRQRVISECERLLRPGGLLFLSHSENLLGIKTGLKSIATAVYEKK